MNGESLLTTLRTLSPEGRSAAMLRHAARFPIVDPTDPTAAEITPEGAATAEALGRRLSGYDRLRLFHSPVKRCRQTAECLAQGARQAGLVIEQVTPEDTLGVDYILDLKEAGRLTVLYGDHFVRRWMEGLIPEDVIRPTRAIMEEKLDYLLRKLAEPAAAGRRLDLHISHDWNVMVLRELLLGLRHEAAGWLTFLDGLVFTQCGSQLEVVYHDHRRTQRHPV